MLLLVLGDSSAASVGIDQIENGLTAQLAALIAASSGRAVRWRAAGFNSATSGQIRDHRRAQPRTPIRGRISCLPSAPTTSRTSIRCRASRRSSAGCSMRSRAKWPEARIVWQPVIALTDVPALPSALAGLLEIRARGDQRAGRQALPRTRRLAGRRGSLSPMPPPAFPATVSMRREAGYRAWAEHLLPFVLGERST